MISIRHPSACAFPEKNWDPHARLTSTLHTRGWRARIVGWPISKEAVCLRDGAAAFSGPRTLVPAACESFSGFKAISLCETPSSPFNLRTLLLYTLGCL